MSTNLSTNARYPGSFNHLIIGKRCSFLGGNLVRIRHPAIIKRNELMDALIFTAVWNPTSPLISLLSMIG